MKFIKLLYFDLKHGVFKSYYKYLFFLLLVSLAFWECHSTLSANDLNNAKFSDYLLYIYGGAKEYIPTPGVAFKLPYLWLLNHVLILFFVLNYMHKDLEGVGQQIIFRARSRNLWWISKCFCQFLSILFYYLLSWLEILCLCLISGVTISFENSTFMVDVMDFGEKLLPVTNLCLIAETTIYPLLFTLCLGFVQMCLSLFIKPIFSYIVSVAVCISSAYRINIFLIGNFSMALRSNTVISNGVNDLFGIFILLVLGSVSIIIGKIKFGKYNILNRE
ncbi:MAG: hypothetical protein IJV39_00625 [Ruminococcus sp.]|nr:hypothetical protein [Ruminococcus sp.]